MLVAVYESLFREKPPQDSGTADASSPRAPAADAEAGRAALAAERREAASAAPTDADARVSSRRELPEPLLPKASEPSDAAGFRTVGAARDHRRVPITFAQRSASQGSDASASDS
jgi:hypothetical protein